VQKKRETGQSEFKMPLYFQFK